MQQEKLGFRCSHLSIRHRLWGENCPMTDIDHLVMSLPALEYDNQKAIALIEYKYGLQPVNLKTANIAAMEDLALKAGLPFYVAQYDPTDWEFCVRPRNEMARAHVSAKTWMGERGFVSLLHELRGRTVPSSLLASLSPDPDDAVSGDLGSISEFNGSAESQSIPPTL